MQKRWPWANPDGTFKREYNWAGASRCDAGCPYCFSCAGIEYEVAHGARWWTDEQAVAAWAAVAEQYGEGRIFLAGLEPGHELPLVAGVALHHEIIMLTNLSCGGAEIVRMLDPARVTLHPSFHAHLWGLQVEPFLAEVALLREAGFVVPLVAIVAWPPYLQHLAGWVEALKGVGLGANVVPARMTTFEGRALPEGYTAEERALIAPHTSGFVAGGVEQPPLQVKACGAGVATVTIRLNGDIVRCGQIAGMGDQNLMRDRTIRFLPEPAPCGEATCRCGHLHRFHIH